MSINDDFWAIIAASYSVGDYADLISRCKSWIRIAELEWTT